MIKRYKIVCSFAILLISLSVDIQAQNFRPNNRILLRILVYGLPNFERKNAEDLVAGKYGFNFYGVAGCIVSQELQDSVEKVNKPIYQAIEKKYGKDFWDRFEKEVDKEAVNQKRIKVLVVKKKYVQQKQKELSKDGDGLLFHFDWGREKGHYDVYAYAWGTDDHVLVYYSFNVDINTGKVVLISRKLTVLGQDFLPF
jgi:hypothetical protein